MRDLDYDVDRALGIPARRPAALLSADVDEVLSMPLRPVARLLQAEDFKPLPASERVKLHGSFGPVTSEM